MHMDARLINYLPTHPPLPGRKQRDEVGEGRYATRAVDAVYRCDEIE